MTVVEAQQAFFNNLDHGAVCPLCGRLGKRFRRVVTPAMARALISLHRLQQGREFLAVETELKKHTNLSPNAREEVPRLRHWGLLERSNIRQPYGGWYRLTDAGRAFVAGKLQIPKEAIVYNGNCSGYAGCDVGIKDCLGKRFNYRALLRGEA